MQSAFIPIFLYQLFFGQQPQQQVVLQTNGQFYHFAVEVADDEAERAQGLMSRLYMSSNRGMIFLYPQERPLAFWMKNTRLSLDIIFFDASGRVVDIKNNVPPCQYDPCPTYPSQKPAVTVLELNAGVARQIGLKIGDSMLK